MKLDRRVLEKDHPFHALFEGRRPPHLFLTTWDGRVRYDLDGRQSQKKLWGIMTKILELEYRRNPESAVRNWLRLLNQFDFLDSRIRELEDQIARLQEKGDLRRAAALEKKLAHFKNDKEKALAREKDLMNLVLRRAPKKKTVFDFDDESAAEVENGGGGAGLLDRIRKGKKPEPAPPGSGGPGR